MGCVLASALSNKRLYRTYLCIPSSCTFVVVTEDRRKLTSMLLPIASNKCCRVITAAIIKFACYVRCAYLTFAQLTARVRSRPTLHSSRMGDKCGCISGGEACHVAN